MAKRTYYCVEMGCPTNPPGEIVASPRKPKGFVRDGRDGYEPAPPAQAGGLWGRGRVYVQRADTPTEAANLVYDRISAERDIS